MTHRLSATAGAVHRLLVLVMMTALLSLAVIHLPQARPAAQIPLIAATLKDDAEEVRRLLDAGADPNEFDDSRNTALIFAARDGRTEIARLLIEAGADPGWTDGELVTPLILAAYKNHIGIAELLLAKGVARDHRDRWGRSALDYAKRRGSGDPIYQLLLK